MRAPPPRGARPQDWADMIGELIDHYRVEELVGRGAMGVVYKALDVNIDRAVAIKVMSVEARNDPAFVERFRQEARLQGALNHPNIALLFDYFVHHDAPVAVMEFIDGPTFDQLIRRRGAIPAHEAIPLFKQALLGVAAAHRAGIIHRDLKAANLMITRDGIVKVMDFGVAKRPGTVDATKASTSVGSPLCMAPEQIMGRPVDVRTDIYALGVTLYQLLTGQPPFNPRGRSEYSILNAHVNDLPDPPSVHRGDIPKPIVTAVMRAIAKEPDARFQSADEFMRTLPDVAAPAAVALPRLATGAAVTPQMGPTGTQVIPHTGPTGTVVIERPGANDAIANEQAGPRPVIPRPAAVALSESLAPTKLEVTGLSHGKAPASAEEVPAMRRNTAAETVIFEYSGRTGLQKATAPVKSAITSQPAAPRAAQTRSGPTAHLRVSPVAIAALLMAMLLLGILHRHQDRLVAMPMGPLPPPPLYLSPVYTSGDTALQARTPRNPTAATTQAPAPPPASTGQQQTVVQAPLFSASAAPDTSSPTHDPAVTPSSTVPASPAVDLPRPTAPRARQDLSGVWRGEYVDAAGKQLLRVISLRIRQVRDDGGIEGMLQYQAASGTGECELHPGGSSYSLGKQRLQLSPEDCSPHYPKELGVPLDFRDVKPQVNWLKDGRIEAPTGEAIRVRLKRISGI